MKFEDIDAFFQNPPSTYLSPEMAVGYILSVLLQGDSYGSGLILQLQHDYPSYTLSDTVLYLALSFLEKEKVIVGYWQKSGTRGRPRRMLKLQPASAELAQEISQLWQNYIASRR